MGDVFGRRKTFDDGRIVFVGADKDRPGHNFIGFRSPKGEDITLCLSDEAAAALKELFNNPMAGMPLARYPFKSEWRIVSYTEKK